MEWGQGWLFSFHYNTFENNASYTIDHYGIRPELTDNTFLTINQNYVLEAYNNKSFLIINIINIIYNHEKLW